MLFSIVLGHNVKVPVVVLAVLLPLLLFNIKTLDDVSIKRILKVYNRRDKDV